MEICNTHWKQHVQVEELVEILRDYINEVKLEIYNKIEDSDDVYIEINLKEHIKEGSQLICNKINEKLIEKGNKFRIIYFLTRSIGTFNLVYIKEQNFIQIVRFYKKLFSKFGLIKIWKLNTIYGDDLYLLNYTDDIYNYLVEKQNNSIYYRLFCSIYVINSNVITNDSKKYILTNMK
jgi:hypothetical protein